MRKSNNVNNEGAQAWGRENSTGNYSGAEKMNCAVFGKLKERLHV